MQVVNATQAIQLHCNIKRLKKIMPSVKAGFVVCMHKN